MVVARARWVCAVVESVNGIVSVCHNLCRDLSGAEVLVRVLAVGFYPCACRHGARVVVGSASVRDLRSVSSVKFV